MGRLISLPFSPAYKIREMMFLQAGFSDDFPHALFIRVEMFADLPGDLGE